MCSSDLFSTVTREALPLLRYRTGDIASLRHGTCVCGRTLVKMSKVTGRRDDMLVVRGVNVYPNEVERVLLAEPGICPDYLLVLDERQAAVRLIACCEYKTAGGAGSPAQAPATAGPPEWGLPAEGELESRLRAELGVSVQVRVLPPGAVPRTEVGKAVRVVRWRDGGPPVPGLD